MIGETPSGRDAFPCSSEAHLSQEEGCSAEHLEGWNEPRKHLSPTSIEKGFLTRAS